MVGSVPGEGRETVRESEEKGELVVGGGAAAAAPKKRERDDFFLFRLFRLFSFFFSGPLFKENKLLFIEFKVTHLFHFLCFGFV